jgi:hypothetical protein
MEKIEDRIIYKKKSLFTCSQNGINTLLQQNIFNLYFYLVKRVYLHNYSGKCRVYIKELNKFLGNKEKNTTNKELCKKILNLESKSIRVNILNNIVKTKRLEPGSYSIPIFGTIYIDPKYKYVEFSITKEMLQLVKITKDDKKYTTVSLSIEQKAVCKYTPKFFEFMSYFTKFIDGKNTRNNDIKVNVENLKEFLSIDKAQYKNFNSFKKRVLLPLQKECSKFGLIFEYDYENFYKSKKVEFIVISMTNTNKNKYQEMIKNISQLDDNNDHIYLQAKEHARVITLKYLKSELFNSDIFTANVVDIKLGNKISMYIFHLKDGNFLPVNFDDLKYIIKYFRYQNEDPIDNIADIGDIKETTEDLEQMHIIKILKGEIARWDN